MQLTELLPALHELPRPEKLLAVEVLNGELAREAEPGAASMQSAKPVDSGAIHAEVLVLSGLVPTGFEARESHSEHLLAKHR